MPLLISDTNIFIDFEEGGLLAKLFQLTETIAVPDILFEEELREQHAHLLDLGLELLELQAKAMQRAVELVDTYMRPSRLDLTALALAEQEQCALLTGDKNLRCVAETEGVVVRGTLWICERLVEEDVITARELEGAYRLMRESGRRLPKDEIEKQIRRLLGR